MDVMHKKWFDILKLEKLNIVNQLLYCLDGSSFKIYLNEQGCNCFAFVIEFGITCFISIFTNADVPIIYHHQSFRLWDLVLKYHTENSEFFQIVFKCTKLAKQLPMINGISKMLFAKLSNEEQYLYIDNWVQHYPKQTTIVDLLPEAFSFTIFRGLVQQQAMEILELQAPKWNIINVKQLVIDYKTKAWFSYQPLEPILLLFGALENNEVKLVQILLEDNNFDVSRILMALQITSFKKNTILFQFVLQYCQDYESVVNLLLFCDNETFIETTIANVKFNLHDFKEKAKFIKKAIHWQNWKMIEYCAEYIVDEVTQVMKLFPHPRILRKLKILPGHYCDAMNHFIMYGYFAGLKSIYDSEQDYFNQFFLLQAAEYGQVEIMKWLQNIDSKISYHLAILREPYGKTGPKNALQIAIQARQIEVCKYLIESSVIPDPSIFICEMPSLLKGGFTKLAILLFTHGALILDDLNKYLEFNSPCLLESVQQRLNLILDSLQILMKCAIPIISSYLADIDHIKLYLCV